MEDVEFRQKLQRYKDTVYRIAYTYLRNQADAEDVSQDTFLKLYLREVPFPDDGAEKAWLIRVTINACHNLRRSVWHKNRAEMPADIAERLTTPAETALYAAVFSCRKNTVWSYCCTITRSIPSKRSPRLRDAISRPFRRSWNVPEKAEAQTGTERWILLWTRSNINSSWNRFRCRRPANKGFWNKSNSRMPLNHTITGSPGKKAGDCGGCCGVYQCGQRLFCCGSAESQSAGTAVSAD